MRNTLVIYIVSTADTWFLRHVYEDLPNITLLVNPTRLEIHNALGELNRYQRVILLGHGDRGGLYNSNLDGYLIGGANAFLLKDLEVIGIFCYASEFADIYGLHGFFTSMFISNFTEAFSLGFVDASPNDIDAENDTFANTLYLMLAFNVPLEEFPVRLQRTCNSGLPFVRFNYEAMCYLN